MKTKLTVEETQHLIDLGVDPKMASEYICSIAIGCITELPSLQPVFNISDLLSILPKEIENNNLNIISTQVDIKNYEKVSGWMVTYIDSRNNLAFGDELIFQASELIDALYQLAIWYLKTKKNEGNIKIN